MSLAVQKSDAFESDYERQFAWYVEKGGDALAWRFQAALDATLAKLARQPDLGRPRRFRHPILRDLRSSPLARPFNRLLIFYRIRGDALQAWRLIHGSRDLPRRLVEHQRRPNSSRSAGTLPARAWGARSEPRGQAARAPVARFLSQRSERALVFIIFERISCLRHLYLNVAGLEQCTGTSN